MAKRVSAPADDDDSRRKLIEFDTQTFHALDVLARDRMMTIQELADEAFRDLLRKHGRPVELREALKRSAGASEPAGKEQQPAVRQRTSGRAKRR
jgi:hypothetical protein